MKIGELAFTNQEIQNVYQEFFGKKGDFSDEIKVFLRAFDSKNFQAAPGCGKTTALAAKLVLMSRNREKVFDNPYQGVCVLTHTNVAVNEIKEKLKKFAPEMMRYPNFIGTIHEFFGIFGKKYIKEHIGEIKRVDDDYRNRYIYDIFSKNKRAENYLKTKYSAIEKLTLDFESEDIIDELNKPLLRNKGDDSSQTYKWIRKVFDFFWKKGIFTHNETLFFSNKFYDNCPNIKALIKSRYTQCLIDESQDVDIHQYILIQKYFNQVPRIEIGDYNQGIYHPREPSGDTGYIYQTNRCSINITNQFSKFAVEKGAGEYVSKNRIEVPTYIILYEKSKISDVKDKYIDLIREHKDEWRNIENRIYKVVGAADNGTSKKNILIKDYTKTPKKEGSEKEITLISLYEWKEYFEGSLRRKYKLAMNQNIWRYVKDEGWSDIEIKEWQSLIAKTSFSLMTGLKRFSENFDLKAKFSEINYELDENLPTIKSDSNIYQYSKNGILIEFNTTHGEKGETHTATMLLDIESYKIKESRTLLEYFFVRKEDLFVDLKKKNSRIRQIYVAMSRPTHLLCVALEKESAESNWIKLTSKFGGLTLIQALEQNGWEVLEI